MAGDVVAYVAVGSNIAPHENVVRAFDMLAGLVRVCAVSTFYLTPPIGRPEQDVYRNGVFCVGTSVSPRELKFEILREVEQRLGRVRSDDAFAARTIDLDLALYGDCVIDEEDLRVPDPDIRTRAFVAFPLIELAPTLELPDTGERLAEVVTEVMRAELCPDILLSEVLKARLGDG